MWIEDETAVILWEWIVNLICGWEENKRKREKLKLEKLLLLDVPAWNLILAFIFFFYLNIGGWSPY
jgi:hypothetical protein